MIKRDYITYRELFSDIIPHFKKTDLMIYLDGSIDTIINRINLRGRDIEKLIDIKYWSNLHKRYNDWIREYDESPVLYVDINKIDLVNNPKHLDALCNEIKNILKI